MSNQYDQDQRRWQQDRDETMSDDAFWKDRLRDASRGVVKCPACRSTTFIDSHTSAGDHPELSTDRYQCNKCDWHSDEWPALNRKGGGQ